LLELAKRFECFRLEHPRGTRVPAELREAALAVLRSGVAFGELYRSCRISWSQVVAWRAGPRLPVSKGKGHKPPPADVRVFSVVDEDPARAPAATVSGSGPELELRIGPWAVSVRIADPGLPGRGSACCP
jgi:hypothetical protein